MMLRAFDSFPVNLGLAGKGNASLPAALVEQTSPKSVAQRRGKKIADLIGRRGDVSGQGIEAEAEAVTA